MKRWFTVILVLVLLLAFAGCGGETGKQDAPVGEQASSSAETADTAAESVKLTDYPKIEELSWTFRNTVRFEEPAAVFDYTNNSGFTIVRFDLTFKMKEGVTSEQLQLVDPISDSLISDEEIADMEPYVLDWIVCDPGETAENASCYMIYNTEPASTEQCDLMELNYADICFIGEDGKGHSVSYSAENGGYSVSDTAEELFVWSDSDYAGMIPKPETRIASVEHDDEDRFYAEAYDISPDYYSAYIEECEQMGFADDYPNDTTSISFSGTNPDGVRVSLGYYENTRHMEITVKKAEN